MPDASPRGTARQRSRSGVLQVVTTTDRRGAEVAATQLGAALTAGGMDTDTVALWPGSATARLDLATLGRRRRDPAALAALVRRARTRSVLVGQGSAALPFGATAATVSRTPFVYRSIGDPTYWATTRARRMRVRAALRRASRVVAIWPGAADSLMRIYGLPASQVEIIPNGVAADSFVPTDPAERPAARRRLAQATGRPIDPDRPLVAYLGALTPEKDPVLAIDAMAGHPDAQLVVAGAGPLLGPVAARAAALPPREVHVVGAVADPAGVLAASDALIVPSRSEGIPAVVIEAGLAALPVVATDVGGIAEVVVDRETGRVVAGRDAGALGRAVAEVLDAPVGVEMGRLARARCLERFTVEVVVAAWLPLLADVAGTVAG